MQDDEDVVTVNTLESKIDTILRAIEELTLKMTNIQDGITRLTNNQGVGALQSTRPSVISQDSASRNPTTILPNQPKTASPNQTLISRNPTEFIEPEINLPERFDGTRSKCQEFVTQVQLVFFLHPHSYPTDQLRVGLVGSLLTGKALDWFNPLFEKESPILDNFEEFLAAFKEAFGKPDRTH